MPFVSVLRYVLTLQFFDGSLCDCLRFHMINHEGLQQLKHKLSVGKVAYDPGRKLDE